MSLPLPSLKQLRAFEAAARLGSFKAAAEELHVTHAAISHQIKALEEYLARPLFHRLTRKVELVPEAAALAERLTQSFEEISDAVEQVRQAKDGGQIRISSVPAFGYRFVLPRLPEFQALHPQIDIQIDLQASVVDMAAGGFDAAIRYGAGDWPGLEARLIFRDLTTPVCAPELVKGRALPLEPKDIAAMPYATSPGADRDWQNWCKAHRLANPARPTPIRLENRAVVLDFLLTGGGVAMTDLRFAVLELQRGQLVRLHHDAIDGVNGTYLVWPKTPVPDPKLTAFGDWLVTAVEAMDLSHGCPWEDKD